MDCGGEGRDGEREGRGRRRMEAGGGTQRSRGGGCRGTWKERYGERGRFGREWEEGGR